MLIREDRERAAAVREPIEPVTTRAGDRPGRRSMGHDCCPLWCHVGLLRSSLCLRAYGDGKERGHHDRHGKCPYWLHSHTGGLASSLDRSETQVSLRLVFAADT